MKRHVNNTWRPLAVLIALVLVLSNCKHKPEKQVSIEPKIKKHITLSEIADSIKYDSAKNIPELVFYLPYDFYNRNWSNSVLEVTSFELDKNSITRKLVNTNNEYKLKLLLNRKEENEISVTIQKKEGFSDIPESFILYPDIVRIIIKDITPLEYYAHEVLLERLYKSNQTELFNTNFYTISLNISTKDYLTYEEALVLDSLINRAKGIEKADAESLKKIKALFDLPPNEIRFVEDDSVSN
ncbi:hypothetical protein [Salibacter halophilus]|uniref:Uncharacterized protein n=1 Tax=Salibacter halophilus TaxID=1803916 RepID=A0A6N6M566_9FLAO|nr:hypothetical protein [Salibacter halophilus]KAB1063484.1 hypothetical protein F3059_10480 [Salibacter halophilus]